MKYIFGIKDYLKNKYKINEKILLLFFIFLFISCLNPYRLEYFTKFILIPISILTILLPNLLNDFRLWLVVSITLTLNLIFNYFFTSNHLFIATYFSWCITLILISKDDLFGSLRLCSKYILVLVLGMATIHKITSISFTDGSFLAYEFLLGLRYFLPIILVWPNFNIFISQNRVNVTDLVDSYSIEEITSEIAFPGGEFFVFTRIFSYITILFEAALFLVFLTYPKYKSVTHILLISFVWFTYVYTNENSFFSMLCILGYMLSFDDQKKFRLLYVLTIFIMLGMDLINFRPSFLIY